MLVSVRGREQSRDAGRHDQMKERRAARRLRTRNGLRIGEDIHQEVELPRKFVDSLGAHLVISACDPFDSRLLHVVIILHKKAVRTIAETSARRGGQNFEIPNV